MAQQFRTGSVGFAQPVSHACHPHSWRSATTGSILHRFAGRQIAGQQRQNGEQQRRSEKDSGIRGAGGSDVAHAGIERGEQARAGPRTGHPDRRAGQHQAHAFPHHQAQDVAPLRTERHANTDLAAALRHGVRGHPGQPDGREHEAEDADEAVGPGAHAKRRHELIDLVRHAAHVEGRDVRVQGVDLAAHGRDGIHARRGAHHEREALRGRHGVVRRLQRKVDDGRWLLHDEPFRHIAGDADDGEEPATAGRCADAIIVGAGQDFGGHDLIAADLDLAAQGIGRLPELSREFLADDDGGRLAGLVFPAEGAAKRDGDAGGIEVVLADYVAQHGARLVGRVAGRGDTEARGSDRDRHGLRQARRGDGRQQLHAIEQLLQECGGLRSGVAVAHRVQRDEVEILRIEARLNSQRGLYTEREQAEDHEQGERAGELAHHQEIAQVEAVASGKAYSAALLQRGSKAAAGGLQGGDESEDESGRSGEERGEQEDAGVGLKVVGDGDEQRHAHAGQEAHEPHGSEKRRHGSAGHQRSCSRSSTGGRCARARRRARGVRQSLCGVRRPGPASCCRRWRRRSAG